NRNLKTLLRVLNTLRDTRGNPISFAEQGDPSLTLGAMLKKLEDQFSRPHDNPPFNLRFEYDKRAFEAEGVNKPPEEVGLGLEKAKIQAERNISLATHLQRILKRVQGGPPSGLIFVIGRHDRVLITTFARVAAEVYDKRYTKDFYGEFYYWLPALGLP